MADQTIYLMDSDVLITAKDLYYAFDLCPGFWKSLLHYHGESRVFNVDRVRNELLAGRSDEDLFRWVKNDVPAEFFLPVDTEEVGRVYSEIMIWVQRHPNYLDHAKAKFATGGMPERGSHDEVPLTGRRGAALAHLNPHLPAEAMRIVPPDGILALLGQVFGPLVEHTMKNALESRILAEIRDLLLSDLMSGKIRLHNIEAVVTEIA